MNNQSLEQSVDILAQSLKQLAQDKLGSFSQTYLDFHAEAGESNSGKGIIFSGHGTTKQFLFNEGPDRFFSSEAIDLSKGKYFAINGIKVLDDQGLGTSITKSNLREVGRLKGLIVDGSVSIDQYIYYNSSSNRLGIGTEEPNAGLAVAEHGVEVVLGTSDNLHGIIGTHPAVDLDIVTDNTPRISIKANGNIELGNSNRNPIQVTVNGKLGVGVKTIDSAVDLHVAGPVRFNGHIHMYASEPPQNGNYNQGDIVWNTEPRQRSFVGWVCVQSGNPGVWAQFGEIR